MKSPFPGMDPYLERHWGDVHHSLIQYARDALQPRLPDDLVARVEARVYLETDTESARVIVPDVSVAELHDAPAWGGGRDAAVAEPVVFELQEVEVTEGYLEIRERKSGKVITVVEFLSPANKLGGVGQKKYLEKQAEVLGSDSSLVEIDLIRAGRPVLAVPLDRIPAADQEEYLGAISPGWRSTVVCRS